MTINCKGNLIDLSQPKVMGILNVTPDSFSDGGKFIETSQILQQVEKMLKEGATFIDVGGYSSRPDAKNIPEDEETQRVLPVIELLLKKFPEILLSVDTFRSKVAQKSIEAGAAMVNDISAGNLDQEMLKTVANLQVPYIMMHMRGTPQTMKTQNEYKDLLQDIIFYFSKKVDEARTIGINDLIVDPGFGFSKDMKQNFEMLSKLELFHNLDLPLLIGASRKSFIHKTLTIKPGEADNGTSIINTVALQKKAHILRVHHVQNAMEAIRLLEEMPH